jgi:hypothetical protein
MASFLAGALLTTILVGLLIVHGLEGTSLSHHAGSGSWFGPVVEIAGGVLAVLLAARLWSKQPPAARPRHEQTSPGRIERLVTHGAPLAFVARVVLNIIPGVLPLVALQEIAELHDSGAEAAALLVGFYLVMFAFMEIPLLGYALAPTATARTTAGFNAWLDRNARAIGVGALALAGVYLIVRGIVRIA